MADPISVIELFKSRPSIDGQDPSVVLLYGILGTDDDLLAKAELAAGSPSTYDGLVRKSLEIEPVGPTSWQGTVRYGLPDAGSFETGESSFAFDTGGGTQHITQSLATVASYPAGSSSSSSGSGVADPPDHHGAIGVTEDSVDGADIALPVYHFSETHFIDDIWVTGAYKAILFALTGRVNNATFKGFAAGECLFLGASGTKRGVGDWEITFRFAASPNATGLTVGSITGIDKKGWEYLWVRYAAAEDAGLLVRRPVAAYVEKVYELDDFSTLGIGT